MRGQMKFSAAPIGTALGSFGVACALALLLLLSGGVGGSGGKPDLAEAGCGALKVRTQVISKYPKAFAAQFDEKLRIAVNRGRSRVRNWQVQLYTFSGFLLGESDVDKKMEADDKAAIKLRLAVQPGSYTLVTKGEVRGCGEVERDEVVKFRGCLRKLPIDFVEKPGGTAADYGRYVSVKIAPKPAWAPISDVYGTLSSFNGDVFGKAELPHGRRKLIGRQFLDFKLKSGGLRSGGYSLYVAGKARQPRSCGDLSKSTTLRFK